MFFFHLFAGGHFLRLDGFFDDRVQVGHRQEVDVAEEDERSAHPAQRHVPQQVDRIEALRTIDSVSYSSLSSLLYLFFFSSIFNPLWTDLIGELFESYWIHIFRKSFKKTPLVCRRCGSRCSFAGSASATRRRRRRTGRPRRPSSTTPNWWDLFRSAMLRCFFKPLFYVFDRQLDWVKLGQVTLYLAGLGWVRFVWVRLG